MKKLIFPSLIALLMLSSFKDGNVNLKIDEGLEKLYKHLGKSIKYPSTAKEDHIQGNSLILFTLSAGQLSGVKIQSELGSNCDIEVLNQLLAYADLKTIKNGNYALKTTFKLDGSVAEVKNATIKIPADYTELALTIVAFAPAAQKTGSSFKIKSYSENNTEVSILSSNRSKIFHNYKIVLDGKEVDTAILKTVNPNNIYSVRILKDTTSATHYNGDRKNATIIITSKQSALPSIKK